MKKLIVLFAGIFMMTIAVQNINAQSQDQATANAAARIIQIIEIAKAADLHFGDIVPDATGNGTVIVTPTGGRSKTGDVTLFDQFTSHQAAQFTVTGEVDYEYTITLPENTDVKLQLTGNDDMDITDWTHNATEILTGGSETFEVGATLNVNINQGAGLYEGTFDVIVNYN